MIEDNQVSVTPAGGAEIQHNRGRVTTSDQLELVWQSWVPTGAVGVYIWLQPRAGT